MIVQLLKDNPRLKDRWLSPISREKRELGYKWNRDMLKANGMELPGHPVPDNKYVNPMIGCDKLTDEEVRGLFNETHYFTVNGSKNLWNYVTFLTDAEAKYGKLYCKESIPKTCTLTSLLKGLKGHVREADIKLSYVLMSNSQNRYIKLLQEFTEANLEAFEEYKEALK